MLDKLKNIFEAQKKMNEIKNGLEKVTIDHEGAGGKLKITMSGTQRLISVSIDDAMLDSQGKDVLEKEIVKCVNSASEKVQKVAAQELKNTMGDLNIPGL